MGTRSWGPGVVALRERLGWNQADLARHSGVAQSVISELESGKRAGVHDDTIERLRRALDVPIGVLLGLEPQPPPLAGELFPRTREFLATELPSLSPAQLAALDRQVVGNLRTALSLLSAAAPSQQAPTAMPSGDTAEPAHGSVNWPSGTLGRVWTGASQRIKVVGRATILARPVAALDG